MFLSIITINRNNAIGLKKTMQSVASQGFDDFEYIVVDGASSDESIRVIQSFIPLFGNRMNWISEPDNGIYNAMNKGIRMAKGDYVEFLNSGDILASQDVISNVFGALETKGNPSILYGNMLKEMRDGTVLKDKGITGRDITFGDFYSGTLNHSPSFIRRSLFDKYGLYDESLKIVSDWKWFLEAIVFGEEKPVFFDFDITLFDMSGISETNKELCYTERSFVLQKSVSHSILSDYENWSFSIDQLKRLKRYPWAYNIVWLLERCLFKWERMLNKRNRPQSKS